MPTSPAPSTPPSSYGPNVNATPITELTSTDQISTWKDKTNELIVAMNSLITLNDLSVLNVAADTARGCQEVRHTDGNVWIGVNPTAAGPIGFDTDGSLKFTYDPTSFTVTAGVFSLLAGITDFVARSKSVQYQPVAQTGHGFTVGTAVYLNTSGVWTKAYSDSPTTALGVVGVVSTVVNANNFILTLCGYLDLGASNATINGSAQGFSPGIIYYLASGSGNAGTYTTTRPTSGGSVKRTVLIGIGHVTSTYNKAIVLNDPGVINDYIRLDGTSSPSADISMNSHKITNVANGVSSTDAANKSQVDYVLSYASSAISHKLDINGGNAMAANLDVGTNKIFNLGPGTNPTDGVNLNQLNTKLSKTTPLVYGQLDMGGTGLAKIVNLNYGTNAYDAVNFAQLGTKVNIDGSSVMGGALDMGTYHRIINMAAGVSTLDAVNYGQLITYLPLAGGTLTGPLTIGSGSYINMGSQYIHNLQPGVASGDATTRGQLDGVSSSLTSAINGKVSKAGDTISGALTVTGYLTASTGIFSNGTVDLGSNQIKHLADGSDGTDAVNVNQLTYVSQHAGGYAGYYDHDYGVDPGSGSHYYETVLATSGVWITSRYAVNVVVHLDNPSNDGTTDITIAIFYGSGLSTSADASVTIAGVGVGAHTTVIPALLFPNITSANGAVLKITSSSFPILVNRISFHAVPTTLNFQTSLTIVP